MDCTTSPKRVERNNLALMILVSLAQRLREAKQELRRATDASGCHSPRYDELFEVENELHNAFELAKGIYRGDEDCREIYPLRVAAPKIRMRRADSFDNCA